MPHTRHESSVIAVSSNPSEAIEGLSGIPFDFGITHYDPPPPDQLVDLEALRQQDRFREANGLRDYMEVEDGRSSVTATSAGPHGRHHRRLGPASVRFPGVHLPTSRVGAGGDHDSARFVQTVGGRMGLRAPRPGPSQAVRPVLAVDRLDHPGTDDQRGRRRQPRGSWVPVPSPATGSTTTRAGSPRNRRPSTSSGRSTSRSVITHRGVGPTLRRSSVQSSRHSSDSCRPKIMGDGAKPKIRTLAAGETLVQPGPAGDARLPHPRRHVRRGGRRRTRLPRSDPGAVVGERAALEGGVRTATLRWRTRARIAETSADQLDGLGLDALAATHRREEQPA